MEISSDFHLMRVITLLTSLIKMFEACGTSLSARRVVTWVIWDRFETLPRSAPCFRLRVQ